MKQRLSLLIVLLFTLSAFSRALAQDPVELRFLWYNDGNEGEVMRDILDQFQADNPDITVVLDTVAYADLHNILQAQVETGEGPDLARITAVGQFAGHYLDLRPLLADADAFEASFPAAVLASMRVPGSDDDGLFGFPSQFTVTGPFINRTLFEQAGIPVPSDESDEVTWEQWTEAAAQVAEATETPYAIAIDRSGHRFWGPSLSNGATYYNEDGSITIDTPGFRQTAEMILGWSADGLMPLEVWAGGGSGYVAANEYFVNGQLVMYMSGSWQVGQFANLIGDTFDWEVVPNPSGPGGSTGIPGGALIVALAGTEHPEEVARVIEYLASEDVLRDFSSRSLFLPGHVGLIESGVEYPSSNEQLGVFVNEIGKLSDEAYALQYRNSAITTIMGNEIRDRLSQVAAGELTLDQAIEQIQETVDEALAAQAAA
jgi:alpha-1,4-digalacturonate transport system substrate-binding protein